MDFWRIGRRLAGGGRDAKNNGGRNKIFFGREHGRAPRRNILTTEMSLT